MAKTEKIILGGVEYTVPQFNLGQLETLTEKIEQGLSHTRLAFVILRMVLARAEPKVEGAIDDLEISTDELMAAQPALLRLAGMEQKAANPPQAPESGAN